MMFRSNTRTASRINLRCWMHHSHRKAVIGIDLSSAARRQVACQKTHREQQRRYSQKSGRIGGAHSEEQGGQETSRCTSPNTKPIIAVFVFP